MLSTSTSAWAVNGKAIALEDTITVKANETADITVTLTLSDAEELNVEQLLAYGVPLYLTHYGLLNLLTEVELNNIRVGGVDQSLDLTGIDREVYGLTVTTQNAGYHTLATNSLSCLLAEVVTLNGIYNDSFHSV
jgi:hypothetical protein